MTKQIHRPEHNGNPDRRVGSLLCAKKLPTFVYPDDPLDKAITLMVINDFSQLPVLDKSEQPKGILRWPTILKGLLDSKPLGKASSWATEARTMHRDRSIYDAFEEVLRYEYVLITEDHTKVCGIVTNYDLGAFAHENLVPFMLVGEIELSLRAIIDKHQLDRTKQQQPNDRRPATNGVKEPSLNELMAVLRHEENWQKLKTKLAQKELLDAIDAVRIIRNALMHFNKSRDANDTEPFADMQRLKLVARFLGQIGLDGPNSSQDNAGA
jgi:hypothetical protein